MSRMFKKITIGEYTLTAERYINFFNEEVIGVTLFKSGEELFYSGNFNIKSLSDEDMKECFNGIMEVIEITKNRGII